MTELETLGTRFKSKTKADRFVKEIIKHERACRYAEWYLDTLSSRPEELEQYREAGVISEEELYTTVYDLAYSIYFVGKHKLDPAYEESESAE